MVLTCISIVHNDVEYLVMRLLFLINCMFKSSAHSNNTVVCFLFAELKVKSEMAQSCPTLCDPVDCSPPAPPPMGFSRQEYWSGLPFPSPGDLPNPGIEPRFLALQADTLTSEPPGNTVLFYIHTSYNLLFWTICSSFFP